jgi:large subunit ribosomal protein L10
MNREQKSEIINDFKQMFEGSNATFLVKYQGLSVNGMQTLRRSLRSVNSELKVTKTTLMKIAAQDIAGSEDFRNTFKEQVGLVFAKGDVSSTAKQLKQFADANEALKVLTGFFESRVLTKQEIEFLATLPSKEILLAQMLGTMQAPIASFTRLLNLLIVRLLYVLKQVEEQKAK